MSKAILVMDMPKCCWDCRFLDPDNDSCVCVLGKRLYDFRTKPDWCPLKECPQKIDVRKAKTETVANRIEGWNACIDEILGGGE